MALKKAWRAIAWLTAIATLAACATSGNEATGMSSSSSSTSSSAGEGGQGGGEGGQGGAAPCGDGTVVMPEECDDGNTIDGDGCSAKCTVEEGFQCAGVHSKCAAKCGDGRSVGAEECDDKNLKKNDGCNDRCEIEYGWACSGTPSECSTNCGDGFLNGKEQCDDGNNTDGDGCSRTCQVEPGYSCVGAPSKCASQCGDGIIAPHEECDDHNFMPGDGCSDTCHVEEHWTCTGAPSVCVTPCGDGFVIGTEACDDGNTLDDDGCSKDCTKDPGYTCTGEPSVCITSCGDGVVAGTEECDDHNTANDDGCNVACRVELGWTCTIDSPSVCGTICGDGFPAGTEACDDANKVDLDGCSKNCTIEKGYVCSNIPSQCVTVCGDGVRGGAEACDDGNTNDKDGCSSACVVEPGWKCTNAPDMPTVCIGICGDGVRVGAEVCDDHNLVNGDCCSSKCLAEAGCEVELNDAISSANDFGALSINGSIKGYIQPAGESDYYKVSMPPNVTVALTIATTDGPTSSCLNNTQDSTVTLYDEKGASLGTDDNSGVGKHCALLVVGGLSGGSNYYIEVKGSKPNLTFDYTLQLGVQITICGDYILQPGEQCDDGNTKSGDGCSQTCTSEPATEVEPNDTPAQANMVGALKLNSIVSAAIGTVGDVDFFRLDITRTVDLRLETFNNVGTSVCGLAVDTKLELRGPNGTAILASNDDKAVGVYCSLINPANASLFSGARHLYPGTYYARVQQSPNTSTIVGYTLVVTPVAICGNGVKEGSEPCDGTVNCDANCDLLQYCGDGIVVGLETCDDGNTTSGDGCSSTCQVESVCGDGILAGNEICDDGNTTSGDGCSGTCQIEGLPNESEPNNNFVQADVKPVLSGSTLIVGSIGVIGDKDVFKLNVTTPSVVRFENFEGFTGDCPTISTTIRLFDSQKAQLKQDTPVSDSVASGIKSCAALVVALDPGAYYVQVEKTGNNGTIPSYSFEVKFETSGGNEVEPNDMQAQANVIPGTDTWVFGNHQVVADSDYFAVTVPAGKSLRAEVIEGDGTETCESNGIDSRLILFSAAGNSLVNDDDGGRGYCSAIDGTGAAPRDLKAHNMAAGTYYLQVIANGSGAAGQFNYKLAVTIR